MNEDEYKDLSRYFRLIVYREEGSLLLDEYNELQDIIQRNKAAKTIDNAYYDFLMGKTSEEDYNSIYNYFYNELDENYIKKLISN